jgi:hypothetical protein
MLTHTSSHSSGRHLDAARVGSVEEPHDASRHASWRMEALYACARACALGWYFIPPSLFFDPHGERPVR